jgi:hypothetical protein
VDYRLDEPYDPWGEPEPESDEEEPVDDLYRDAVVEGVKEYYRQTGEYMVTVPPVEAMSTLGAKGRGYWIARYAARKATDALLLKAREIGVTEEQWEALRVVAADVAYD